MKTKSAPEISELKNTHTLFLLFDFGFQTMFLWLVLPSSLKVRAKTNSLNKTKVEVFTVRAMALRKTANIKYCEK